MVLMVSMSANAGFDALIPEEYDKRDLGIHGDMRSALSIWSFQIRQCEDSSYSSRRSA